MRTTFAFAAVAVLACSAVAQSYRTDVVVRGLERPTGITVAGSGHSTTLYITQLPTPGVGGTMGGRNTVDSILLASGRVRNLTMGEPEPTNLAIGNGNLYWTCRSAGVILRRSFFTGRVSPFLTGLQKPTGIAVGEVGEVYFTQVPTPGVPGSAGGTNTVDVSILGRTFNLTRGEPEPTDIVAAEDGSVYWTCKSAGVILERDRFGSVTVLQSGLESPTGITLDCSGRYLFWTEVPTPGVPGTMGGRNRVVRLDLHTGAVVVVDAGDPEPTDITVSRRGDLYWTCSSAGVIVRARMSD
jgi:streptogramin lyase